MEADTTLDKIIFFIQKAFQSKNRSCDVTPNQLYNVVMV